MKQNTIILLLAVGRNLCLRRHLVVSGETGAACGGDCVRRDER